MARHLKEKERKEEREEANGRDSKGRASSNTRGKDSNRWDGNSSSQDGSPQAVREEDSKGRVSLAAKPDIVRLLVRSRWRRTVWRRSVPKPRLR